MHNPANCNNSTVGKIGHSRAGAISRARTPGAFNMTRIAFPALQQLLLSAENLVSLHLEALPSSGYISPEATLIFLPVMTRLENLHFYFLSPIYRPILRGRNPALQRRAVLPALENFAFHSVGDDLECLSSRIDALNGVELRTYIRNYRRFAWNHIAVYSVVLINIQRSLYA
jgi:hypothetical protein